MSAPMLRKALTKRKSGKNSRSLTILSQPLADDFGAGGGVSVRVRHVIDFCLDCRSSFKSSSSAARRSTPHPVPPHHLRQGPDERAPDVDSLVRRLCPRGPAGPPRRTPRRRTPPAAAATFAHPWSTLPTHSPPPPPSSQAWRSRRAPGIGAAGGAVLTPRAAPAATTQGCHRPSTPPAPPPARRACAAVRHVGRGAVLIAHGSPRMSFLAFVCLRSVVRAGRRPRVVVVVAICESS